MTDALTDFALVARDFTGWCNSPLPPGATSKLVFSELRSHLAAIYLAALDLPKPPEAEDSLWDAPTPRLPQPSIPDHFRTKLDLLGLRRYEYAFNPLTDADVLSDGDLYDDLLSVLTWIKLGLELYDAGHVADAWWDWWWDLDGHAGHHLASALYVLQSEATYGERGLSRND